MASRIPLAEAVAAAFSEPGPLVGGAVVRLQGDLRDIQDDRHRARWRTSPPVHLESDAVARIVESLRAQGPAEAADVFTEAFGDAYGFAADVGLVERLVVWPEGAGEPQ